MGQTITKAHGGGGRLMHDLVDSVFRRNFNNEILDMLDDSAGLGKISPDAEVFFTTDSYVVYPHFFPGGDIGKLAVCGTLNDLSVCGAAPSFLSAGFIVEEGFEIKILEAIAQSMADEAKRGGVKIVTGDFKVVENGAADGVFINTSGIGFKSSGLLLGKEEIVPGDKIILNGPVGDHEIAVLLERGDFKLRGCVKSDCCNLYPLLKEVFLFHEKVLEESGDAVLRFMRDPTRGGAAAALNEIVSGMGFGAEIYPGGLPVRDEVSSVCELLGLDPAYLANEGKAVMVVNGKYAERALDIMKRHPSGGDAVIFGEVVREPAGRVIVKTILGSGRILRAPEGSMLPRIC